MALALNICRAEADETWQAKSADSSKFPQDLVVEMGKPAPGGLPDGKIATAAAPAVIIEAWYAGATHRYDHGILGDAIEASTLKIRRADGEVITLNLPDTEVFEDRTPRLADLDRDGITEVVTIRSSTTLGGSISVYGLSGGALVLKASTPFIGLSHRWLNIAAIADLTGSGHQDIAYVQTPHIGGTLYVVRYDAHTLTRIAALPGFSNHVIGSREMRLSAVADINGNGRFELAVPNDSRRSLRIVGFAIGKLSQIAEVKLPALINKAIAVEGTGRNTRFVVGLNTGAVYVVER